MSKAHNARYAKLQVDYTDLMNLAGRSDFIKIDPVDMEPGWPPEKYLITFTCAGIAAVKKPEEIPIVSVHHEVEMYLSAEYPMKIPSLLWRTDIWHPNIEHAGSRHVCTNDVQTFFASKPISELVLFMAEMVQYRRYHAKIEPPYPLDLDAARWVREVAEPKGWIAPDRPFDPRPLLREHRISKASKEEIAAANGGSFHPGFALPPEAPPADPVPPNRKIGIKLGTEKSNPEPPPSPKTGGISLGRRRVD